MRVAAEAAVLDQDLVWAVASLAVVAEELELAVPAAEAQARAHQPEGVAAPAAALMPGICGVRRGREAIAVVAQGREPVEVLAVAQAVPVAPEGVVAAASEAALAGAAREQVLQVAAPAAEVASEVVAEVAQLEALPVPAGTQANG
jgi:hypothetical protein